MYKKLFLILLSFFSLPLLSRESVKENSSFRIMGNVSLYEQPTFERSEKYISLNHEGGIKVCVLEIGKKDIYENKSGVWLKVITELGFWTQTSEWVDSYQKFWIFLTDETEVFF